MSEEKKDNVTIQDKKNDKQAIVYKKPSELTYDDLNALDQAIVTIKNSFNKKTNQTTYLLTIQLFNQMEFTQRLTKNQYLLIILKRKLDSKIMVNSFKCPIRFITGSYDNDTVDSWIKYELFVIGGLTISEFIGNYDRACVKLLGDKFGYNLIVSPEKFVKNENEDINEEFYD